MNTTHRAKAGAGMLLLSAVALLDNARDDLLEFLGIARERGKFQLIGAQADAIGKREMLGAALACLAVLLLGGGLLAGGSLAHLLALGTLAAGAAGVFTLERPADAPLPQYTFVGVYVGGTSDTSPLDIPFATYNTAFADRVMALGVAPIPDVFVAQALGTGVSAVTLTASTTNLILTFTLGEGDNFGGYTATIGCTIPNTPAQP